MPLTYRQIPNVAKVGRQLRDEYNYTIGELLFASINDLDVEYVVINGFRSPPLIVGTPKFKGLTTAALAKPTNPTVKCQYKSELDLLRMYPKSIGENIIILHPNLKNQLELKYGGYLELPEGKFRLLGKQWIDALGKNINHVLEQDTIYFFPECFQKLPKNKKTPVKAPTSKEKLQISTTEHVTAMIGTCPQCKKQGRGITPLFANRFELNNNNITISDIYCINPTCNYTED